MKKQYLRIVILLISIILIETGIALGQPIEVMNKAIHICLECIGIG